MAGNLAAATWIRPLYVPHNPKTKFASSVDVVADDEIGWNILHVINASIRRGSTVPIMGTLPKRRCLSNLAVSSSTHHPTRRCDIRHRAASCQNHQYWSLPVQTSSSSIYVTSFSELPSHSFNFFADHLDSYRRRCRTSPSSDVKASP
jgi:hypothetical protein